MRFYTCNSRLVDSGRNFVLLSRYPGGIEIEAVDSIRATEVVPIDLDGFIVYLLSQTAWCLSRAGHHLGDSAHWAAL